MADDLVTIRLSSPAATPARAKAVYVETYGCQMNVADTDLMIGLLAERGFRACASAADADVILLNTCAVREKAEERVLARAAELAAWKRRRPGVVLGITGCMAEHLREKLLERAPYVDVVAGPDAYRRLPSLVEAAEDADDPLVDVRLDRNETYEGLGTAAGGDGVSGFVTIQRGCDKFCTFCVVPYTRGRERGTPPREVLRQVRALADAGYKEVTLLGQTVNSYRHADARFSDLLRAVAGVDGIERVRFTSPYPIDFTDDVIAAIAEEPKVCKHVHLPLQTASDAVLARMKRGYSFADYVGVVAALRRAAPDLALTTDILVGFSGETPADHELTLAAMRDIRFDAAFTFAYSQRAGTFAEKRLPDDVPPDEKNRRLSDVIRLQERICAEVNAAHVGRTFRVLLHAPSKRNDDELLGRTDGFKAVIVPRADRRPGDLVDVVVRRATSATLFA
ncbi:MAG TPA: tRNA (N6-isopentenyl adenosine(37)-C2)-methylthiotransferase MiaB [Haliangiales bacterium]|nr:tRNA (N6-isopentenyl adenosine(37)-C2)-methylthiotransferase MiaB [Haliangiales bacterium]